jgi:hypothetical protein
MMHVEQMINSRGNGAMNQFVITDKEHNTTTFQSYNSMIVTVDDSNKTITIGEDYNYSRTTGKHRNIFFKDYTQFSELATLAELNKAIKKGFCRDYRIVEA